MSVTIPQQYIKQLVQLALTEDIGSGDVTAELIPADEQAIAEVISREHAILCGQQWFDEVFQQLDGSISITGMLMMELELTPSKSFANSRDRPGPYLAANVQHSIFCKLYPVRLLQPTGMSRL